MGCSNSSPNSEVHPKPENLPHISKTEAELLLDNTSGNKEEFPWQVQLLQSVIMENADVKHRELPFRFHNSFGIYWETVSNRQVAFHVGSDKLYEVNLDTFESYQVAGPGNGPSEISHATSLFQAEDTVYVAGSDGRVRSFNCQSEPCEYNKSFKIGASIQGGTSMPGGVALMTQPFMTEENRIENRHSAYMYNHTGTFQRAFGDSYDSNNWMVKDLYSQGDINFDGTNKVFILFFSHFPYLYVYTKSEELIGAFKIPEFDQSKVMFDTKSGGRSVDINSLITRLNKIADGKYVLRISHNNDFRDEEGRSVYNREYDFFYLKLDVKELSFVGRYTHQGYEIKDVQVTKNGVFTSSGGIQYFTGRQGIRWFLYSINTKNDAHCLWWRSFSSVLYLL